MNAKRFAVIAFLVALAALARTLWVPVSGGVTVHIANDSKKPMTRVVLSMDDGSKAALPDILPDQKVTAVVRPRGEALLELDWAEQTSSTKAATYIESNGGYVVDFSVNKDGVAAIEERIGGY